MVVLEHMLRAPSRPSSLLHSWTGVERDKAWIIALVATIVLFLCILVGLAYNDVYGHRDSEFVDDIIMRTFLLRRKEGDTSTLHVRNELDKTVLNAQTGQVFRVTEDEDTDRLWVLGQAGTSLLGGTNATFSYVTPLGSEYLVSQYGAPLPGSTVGDTTFISSQSAHEAISMRCKLSKNEATAFFCERGLVNTRSVIGALYSDSVCSAEVDRGLECAAFKACIRTIASEHFSKPTSVTGRWGGVPLGSGLDLFLPAIRCDGE